MRHTQNISKGDLERSALYPIPPDLDRNDVMGFRLGEIAAVLGLAAGILLAAVGTGYWPLIAWEAFPAALGVLLHRRDNGYGYTAAGRPLWVMLRYTLADLRQGERFSLRGLLHDEYGEKEEQELEETDAGPGAGAAGSGIYGDGAGDSALGADGV